MNIFNMQRHVVLSSGCLTVSQASEQPAYIDSCLPEKHRGTQRSDFSQQNQEAPESKSSHCSSQVTAGSLSSGSLQTNAQIDTRHMKHATSQTDIAENGYHTAGIECMLQLCSFDNLVLSIARRLPLFSTSSEQSMR